MSPLNKKAVVVTAIFLGLILLSLLSPWWGVAIVLTISIGALTVSFFFIAKTLIELIEERDD